jgi:predicted secreted protein
MNRREALQGMGAAMMMASAEGVEAQSADDAGAASVTVVSGQQTFAPVSLGVGDVLEVRLDANHTTGYNWIVVPVVNPVLMRQGSAKYEEHPSGGKTAVGGVEVWRFKAMKAGKQGLQFEYRRPWENGVPAAKVVTFSVTAQWFWD